jgi:hypothetical protein
MVFAVPLKPTGYAMCVVTRHGRSAVTVGHFFGPAVRELPSLPETLDPLDVALVARFGDIPIFEDVWPLLGVLPAWDRDMWPSTRFRRVDPGGWAYLEEYDDRNPNKLISSRSVPPSEVADLPDDALMGYMIVRSKLSSLLAAEELLWQ